MLGNERRLQVRLQRLWLRLLPQRLRLCGLKLRRSLRLLDQLPQPLLRRRQLLLLLLRLRQIQRLPAAVPLLEPRDAVVERSAGALVGREQRAAARTEVGHHGVRRRWRREGCPAAATAAVAAAAAAEAASKAPRSRLRPPERCPRVVVRRPAGAAHEPPAEGPLARWAAHQALQPALQRLQGSAVLDKGVALLSEGAAVLGDLRGVGLVRKLAREELKAHGEGVDEPSELQNSDRRPQAQSGRGHWGGRLKEGGRPQRGGRPGPCRGILLQQEGPSPGLNALAELREHLLDARALRLHVAHRGLLGELLLQQLVEVRGVRLQLGSIGFLGQLLLN
mmetsp:Transcript_59009/g.169427  ORF Transcript_59009/g.169427 Transcript_59009/m.169427 type:complete len:336 (-) Transcript_59009:974-1981(-)